MNKPNASQAEKWSSHKTTNLLDTLPLHLLVALARRARIAWLLASLISWHLLSMRAPSLYDILALGAALTPFETTLMLYLRSLSI